MNFHYLFGRCLLQLSWWPGILSSQDIVDMPRHLIAILGVNSAWNKDNASNDTIIALMLLLSKSRFCDIPALSRLPIHR
jgi:hypothetical protein